MASPPADTEGRAFAFLEVNQRAVKPHGPEVNLFVDHSQIVQLECLRAGVWGTESLWGRVLTSKG
jgi:phosphosulfolactate synthase (CoM biosynthesis protein A)